MIMKDDALQSLIGGVGWSVKGDTVIYHADAPREPSDEEITTEMARLEAEYTAQEYARSRAAEYPSTGDQLDYIFHNGVAKWKSEMVDPIKAKWPKDNSGPV